MGRELAARSRGNLTDSRTPQLKWGAEQKDRRHARSDKRFLIL